MSRLRRPLFPPRRSMSFPTRRRIGITTIIINRPTVTIRITADGAIRRCHFHSDSAAAIAAVITAAVGVAATGAVIRAVIMAAAAGIADVRGMGCWSDGAMERYALPVRYELMGTLNIQHRTSNIEPAEPQPNSMLDVGRSMFDVSPSSHFGFHPPDPRRHSHGTSKR